MICSDGDLMEGVSYEAGSIAGTNGLGKLIYFYDDNHITIDGTTSISFTEDRAKRFEALGWHVQSVADANDLDALRAAIASAQAETDATVDRSSCARTSATALRTRSTPRSAHGSPLGADEVAATKRALGWDPDKQFVVPDEVCRAHEPGRARSRARGASGRQTFDAWSDAFPGERETWDAAWAGEIGEWTRADVRSPARSSRRAPPARR